MSIRTKILHCPPHAHPLAVLKHLSGSLAFPKGLPPHLSVPKSEIQKRVTQKERTQFCTTASGRFPSKLCS